MKQILRKVGDSIRNNRIFQSGRPIIQKMQKLELGLMVRFGLAIFLSAGILSMGKAMGIGQSSIIRIFFGIIFIGIFPGDAFLLVMFPRRKSLDPLERFIFTIIISVIIIALVGFLLNYTLWGITLESLLFATDIIIVICYAIFFFQRREIRKMEIKTEHETLGTRSIESKPKPSRKAVLSIAASLIGLIALILLIGLSGPSEKYTEFLILDDKNQLGIERNNFTLGETLPINLVVINHEGRTEIYYLFLIDNNNSITRIASVPLDDQKQWIQLFQIDLLETGENQVFKFVLYREGDVEPYRSLQIVISVYK
jgi:uncharacterized membrane protein